LPGKIKWVNIWTGREVEKRIGEQGGEWEHHHEAKLGFPPIFCRKGS